MGLRKLLYQGQRNGTEDMTHALHNADPGMIPCGPRSSSGVTPEHRAGIKP